MVGVAVVIIRGNDQLWTLLHLKYQRHVIAAHGEGSGNRKHGADGKDAVIEGAVGHPGQGPRNGGNPI